RIAIGMDPSLSGFAVCLIDGDEVDLEEFASQPTGITIRERFSRYQRHCRMIMRWVMQQCNLKGMAVGIEGYSYGSEWKSESMAEFGCWIRRDLILAGAIPVEITPTQVRKFATGRGGGKGVTKQAVASALTKRYGVEFDSDNKSDA